MLIIKVDTSNAAFEDNDGRDEIARILKKVAQQLEGGEDFSHFRTVFDINGNDVGRVKLTGDE